MSSSNALTPVTLADVEEASRTLAGKVVRTPLLESPLLNERLGGRLFVKAECLQRTGSFKYRGAYNCIAHLDPAARSRGVVAYSSGNHAQGVAAAARVFGIPAVIVMPSDAPQMKIDNTKAYGAEVVLYDRDREDREEIGRRIESERGLALVRPYDDRYVVAGQGTTGLEIADDLAALGVDPDALVVPCSGGGLIAGTATGLKSRFPNVAAYSAEPAEFDDTARSLAAGTRQSNVPGRKSICDALLVGTPGKVTFEINKALLAGGVVATDAEALRAMRVAFEFLKICLEPGGAAALAAVLAGQVPVKGQAVVVVGSGGNADPAMFARALAQD